VGELEALARRSVEKEKKELQSKQTPRDVVEKYFRALNRADAVGVSTLIAEDGVVMADGFPSVAGQDQIRQMFEGAFAAMRMKRRCHVDDVGERDGLAVVRTHLDGASTLAESGAVVEQDLREL
jgi:uncharacterized protein (TIGR02246 family)